MIAAVPLERITAVAETLAVSLETPVDRAGTEVEELPRDLGRNVESLARPAEKCGKLALEPPRGGAARLVPDGDENPLGIDARFLRASAPPWKAWSRGVLEQPDGVLAVKPGHGAEFIKNA